MKIYILSHTHARTHTFTHTLYVCVDGCARDIAATGGAAAATDDVAVASLLP